MREGFERNLTFDESTAVPRRESLLLTIYALDLGQERNMEWLPPFSLEVMQSVLGLNPGKLNRSQRRKVSYLFLIQFDRLLAFSELASYIKESWKGVEGPEEQPAKTWHAYAKEIFSEKGPANIAELRQDDERVSSLAARFEVPEESLFFDRLYEEVILNRLRTLGEGVVDKNLFDDIENEKQRRCSGGQLLGSLAVQIMVRRSRNEFDNKWTKAWARQIVPFSCDPRILNPQQMQTWWGWATEQERRSAIRGLTGLTLNEFIDLLNQSLRGTDQANQFSRRRDFLKDLFRRGRILDVRLVVNASLFQRFDLKVKESLRVSKVRGRQASFICLKCVDDVHLIEGTHSFGLRGFIGEDAYPVRRLWKSAEASEYRDDEFRISVGACDLYQQHHNGDWIGDFRRQLRSWHIEW
ncbi:EH signature domain-containing protein [bacterium]|nr:EH signature domain-containing protein [bacterium]